MFDIHIKNLCFDSVFFNVLYSINAIFCLLIQTMDYKKKSLSKLKKDESYEEIDTRLASGWYVDALNGDNNKSNNKKKYKTKEVVFKISKKSG